MKVKYFGKIIEVDKCFTNSDDLLDALKTAKKREVYMFDERKEKPDEKNKMKKKIDIDKFCEDILDKACLFAYRHNDTMVIRIRDLRAIIKNLKELYEEIYLSDMDEKLSKKIMKGDEIQKKIDDIILYKKLSFNSAMSNLVGMINNFDKVDVMDLKRLFSQLKSFENDLEKILKGD